jgi:hypothetical protein
MGRWGAGESRKLSLLWGDWVEPFATQTLGRLGKSPERSGNTQITISYHAR